MRRRAVLGVIILLGMMLTTTGCQFYMGETVRGDGERIVEQRDVESSIPSNCAAAPIWTSAWATSRPWRSRRTPTSWSTSKPAWRATSS